jgi:hypothetical protein
LVVNPHFCMDGESFGQLNVAHNLPEVGLRALLDLSGLDIIGNREIYDRTAIIFYWNGSKLGPLFFLTKLLSRSSA